MSASYRKKRSSIWMCADRFQHIHQRTLGTRTPTQPGLQLFESKTIEMRPPLPENKIYRKCGSSYLEPDIICNTLIRAIFENFVEISPLRLAAYRNAAMDPSGVPTFRPSSYLALELCINQRIYATRLTLYHRIYILIRNCA